MYEKLPTSPEQRSGARPPYIAYTPHAVNRHLKQDRVTFKLDMICASIDGCFHDNYWDRRALIEKEAYYRWQQHQGAKGDALHDWLDAEQRGDALVQEAIESMLYEIASGVHMQPGEFNLLLRTAITGSDTQYNDTSKLLMLIGKNETLERIKHTLAMISAQTLEGKEEPVYEDVNSFNAMPSQTGEFLSSTGGDGWSQHDGGAIVAPPTRNGHYKSNAEFYGPSANPTGDQPPDLWGIYGGDVYNGGD